MRKKITTRPKMRKPRAPREKDLEELQENLEKTGEALGDLFKGIFKGVGRILEVAQEMEEKGEETRSFSKEIKGITKSGKEFRGKASWKMGFLDAFLKRKREGEKEEENK